MPSSDIAQKHAECLVQQQGRRNPALHRHQHKTILQCSEDQEEFKDVTIVHLYNRKGNPQCCDNHHVISLNCRKDTKWFLQHDNYRRSAKNKHNLLFIVIIDLMKALDTIWCKGLRKIMAKYILSKNFIAIVKPFHEEMVARVLDEGELSEAFQVTNGVIVAFRHPNSSVCFFLPGWNLHLMTSQTSWSSTIALMASCLIWGDWKAELKWMRKEWVTFCLLITTL